MKFKALFFDVDSTLLDFGKAEEEALKSLQTFMNDDSDFQSFFNCYHEINQAIWLELEEKKITPDGLKVERFRRFAAATGHSASSPEELSAAYLKALGQGAFYLEEAEELLESLKGRCPMAIITNGLSAVQDSRFKILGFDNYFDVIMNSEREGSSKPETVMFERAAAALALPLDKEILMIGDSLTSDIAGGNAAGVSTCWYNPGGWTNESPHKADYEIGNLKELLTIVGV